MPDDLLRFCIDTARATLAKVEDWQKDGDAAVQSMKDALEAREGASWHVVVGKHFGSRVTHDARNFVFFYVGDKAVLMFKCG